MYYINTLICISIFKNNAPVNSPLLFYSPMLKYYSRVYPTPGGFQKSARGDGGGTWASPHAGAGMVVWGVYCVWGWEIV